MTYMCAVGPLGRSAPDLRTALSVTGGPEGQQAKAYSWVLSPSRHTRLEDFRVGVVLDHEQAPVSSEVTAPLSSAVDELARAGATVVEGWPEGVDPMRDYESFGFHVQLFFAFQEPGEDFATLSEVIDYESRRVAAPCRLEPLLRRHRCFLVPGKLHASLPARRQTLRRTHDHDARRRAALQRPGFLDIARIIGRLARRGCTRRSYTWRTSGRGADRGSALRRRHGDHVRRIARRCDRRVRTPAPLVPFSSISSLRSSRESPRTSTPNARPPRRTPTSRRGLRPPHRRAQAGGVSHRGGHRPQTWRRSRCPGFAGPAHSDLRMTLAIYTRPTKGMQDPATAALDVCCVVCKVKRGPSEIFPSKGASDGPPELTPQLALLEEAMTILFCRIDDTYYHLNPKGCHYETLKVLSDSEVITLALFQQLRGIESRALFPARGCPVLLAPVPRSGGSSPLLVPSAGRQAQALLGALAAKRSCPSW